MTPELTAALDEYLVALGNAELARRGTPSSLLSIWYYDKPRPNQKFIKVVALWSNGQQFVHSFVEIATGNVFKPAGWSAPARNSFYNLLDPVSKDQLFKDCDPIGAYLYADFHKKAKA
jgi:hypothetical protein